MTLFASTRQAPLFAVFFCVGAMLGALYGFFGIFRKSKALTVISDIIFSLSYLALFCATSYYFNFGKTEAYFYIAIASGFFAERAIIGYFTKKPIYFFATFLYNLYMRLKSGGSANL